MEKIHLKEIVLNLLLGWGVGTFVGIFYFTSGILNLSATIIMFTLSASLFYIVTMPLIKQMVTE